MSHATRHSQNDAMLLQVIGMGQRYGSADVLGGISFTLTQGSCCTILGRNGAGKTTLLKTLLGIMPPAAGSIVFAGKDITNYAPHRRARLGMGYVPQGRGIFADLSVRQNLRVVMAANGIDVREQLAFARALATRPSLLVLDEPTEGIQPTIVQAIEDVIRTLNGKLSILLVEQHYDFARSLADSYLVIERGCIVAQGAGGMSNGC